MTVAEDILTITQAGPPSTTTIGVYFSSNQTFYLRNSNSPGFADFSRGTLSDGGSVAVNRAHAALRGGPDPDGVGKWRDYEAQMAQILPLLEPFAPR